MGTRGPAPKTEDTRRRRNKPESPVEKIAGASPCAPELDLPGVHPLAQALYESIADSPEARYFTPAVWQRARISTQVLSTMLTSGRVGAQMYAAIQSDWKDFLISPADQRRLGIEVQKAAVEDPHKTRAVAKLDDYRKLVSG